jgi:hypothetical protein
MTQSTLKTRDSITNLISEQPAVNVGRRTKSKRRIGEVTVLAKDQPHLSLGTYTAAHPPKGFAIHITPDPEPDAIVTQITQLGSDKKYELVLHIANYGNEDVSAEVWQL